MRPFQKPGNRALKEMQIIKQILSSAYPKCFIAVAIQV